MRSGRRTGRAIVSGCIVAGALAMPLIAALPEGRWDLLLGFAAGLVVIVPLFWLLHHPRRPRRRRTLPVKRSA